MALIGRSILKFPDIASSVRADHQVYFRFDFLSLGGQRCANFAQKGSTHEFLASDYGLSDVTDRSHHWIGGISAKSFLA
jgi:hypothetical protein